MIGEEGAERRVRGPVLVGGAARELERAATLDPRSHDVALTVVEARRPVEDFPASVWEAAKASVILLAPMVDPGYYRRDFDATLRLWHERRPGSFPTLALLYHMRGERDQAVAVQARAVGCGGGRGGPEPGDPYGGQTIRIRGNPIAPPSSAPPAGRPG